MRTTIQVLGLAASYIMGTTASAQPTHGGWRIEVIGEPVSPSNPTTTVRVSAYFPVELWAFGSGGFDLIGSDTNASLSDFMIPEPLGPRPPGPHGCFGLWVDRAIPGGVIGVAFGQINIVGCIAHPSNPLPIFEAQWTTNDFRPRQVQLETHNTPAFRLYPSHNSTLDTVDLVATNQFRHGSAVIHVIPGPSAAALLLGASGAVLLRRRRRMSPQT